MTLPLGKLIAVYDLVMPSPWAASPPTRRSIARINKHFGIKLPSDLVRFAVEASKFGAWFASLGEDYDNPLHIIQLNEVFHAPTRCGYEESEGVLWRPMPSHLIMINHGHDDDCDCIDLSVLSPVEGEYFIHYWAPDADEGRLFDTFSEYIESLVMYWAKKVRKEMRAAVNAAMGA